MLAANGQADLGHGKDSLWNDLEHSIHLAVESLPSSCAHTNEY